MLRIQGLPRFRFALSLLRDLCLPFGVRETFTGFDVSNQLLPVFTAFYQAPLYSDLLGIFHKMFTKSHILLTPFPQVYLFFYHLAWWRNLESSKACMLLCVILLCLSRKHYLVIVWGFCFGPVQLPAASDNIQSLQRHFHSQGMEGRALYCCLATKREVSQPLSSQESSLDRYLGQAINLCCFWCDFIYFIFFVFVPYPSPAVLEFSNVFCPHCEVG